MRRSCARSKLRAPAKLVRPCLPSATTMIILEDLISHDEMFSDIYKIWEGLRLEVEGKMVSRTEGNIDDLLIGRNASAEGPECKGTGSTVVTGVDMVMNHHLQETSFTKEAYKKSIKDYMKSIKGKLEEQRPERVKPFMIGAAEQIEHILANFKSYQFFTGANMNPVGTAALLDYRKIEVRRPSRRELESCPYLEEKFEPFIDVPVSYWTCSMRAMKVPLSKSKGGVSSTSEPWTVSSLQMLSKSNQMEAFWEQALPQNG
ncbi:TPT1-like protein [Heterocephalus glaber]|uniref:Translationally-controlled tumor protein n=1 Tax=Heterocephalus glaber TaxID=10181 RepID=A0AAX6QZ76_HETGA|nr:TPT1-like protein [Heterocephalus glaber]